MLQLRSPTSLRLGAFALASLLAAARGEATAVYLSRALAALSVAVTRPAHGLPVSGDLEYADELTLARALAGRQAF